jgi:hypothetical protein
MADEWSIWIPATQVDLAGGWVPACVRSAAIEFKVEQSPVRGIADVKARLRRVEVADAHAGISDHPERLREGTLPLVDEEVFLV